jgi:hypothetical protein
VGGGVGQGNRPRQRAFLARRDPLPWWLPNAAGRRAWNHIAQMLADRMRDLPLTDLPTAHSMLPQDGWLCLLVWCKACPHQAT